MYDRSMQNKIEKICLSLFKIIINKTNKLEKWMLIGFIFPKVEKIKAFLT